MESEGVSAGVGVGSNSSGVEIELEHAIAFSGIPDTLHYHPDGKSFVHAAGSAVVIANFTDPHDQTILRGHDAAITCLALSKTVTPGT